MTTFIEVDDESAPSASAIPITPPMSEPSVIKYTDDSGDTYYWSDTEHAFVAPSGDVTFYNSNAILGRALASLKGEFAPYAAKILSVGASVLSAPRSAPGGIIAAREERGRPELVAGRDFEWASEQQIREAYSIEPEGWLIDDEGDRIENDEGLPLRRKPVVVPQPGGIVTHNEGSIDTSKCSHINDLVVTASHLKAKLGAPKDGDGYNTSTVWAIQFDDGQIAVVCDWQRSSTYREELPEPDEIRNTNDNWHVMGTDVAVFEKVKALLSA